MKLGDWKRWVLAQPPEHDEIEVACGAMDDPDRFVPAAPFSPEEIPLTLNGRTVRLAAIVVGFDFGKTVAPSWSEQQQNERRSTVRNAHRVVKRGSRRGCGGRPSRARKALVDVSSGAGIVPA